MRNAVGDDDDAVRLELLGPSGGHLAVEQTAVDAHASELDVAVTKHRPRRDRACGRGRGRGRLLVLGLEALRLNADAVLALGHEVRGDFLRRLGCVEARGVRLDEHRQVEARDDGPSVVAVDEGARLVEGRAAPQVNEEQNLLLVVQSGNGLLELGPELIGAHARLQAHDGNIWLVTKDHRAGLLDAGCQIAMACKDDSYHSLPPITFRN